MVSCSHMTRRRYIMYISTKKILSHILRCSYLTHYIVSLFRVLELL